MKPTKEQFIPTLDSLKSEVIKAGYTVSAGSWEDESVICAFSAESVPGTFGHPRFEAFHSKTSGWTGIGNKRFLIEL